MRRATFEALYTEHAERLYSFLAYRTGDPSVAEDLLSSTFERAIRGRAGFDRRRGNEGAWLFTIALNLVRDRARRLETEQNALERAGRGEQQREVSDENEALVERDAVMGAVATLSAEEREIIALRFGADLTAPQIAAVLDVPLTTVEGRLYRALRKLRSRLEVSVEP